MPSKKTPAKPYVVVRCRNAGCFAGTLESRTGGEVTLSEARRIWYWDGAAELSSLAVDGTSKPGNCKFPCAVPQVILLDACEVISTTKKGADSIKAVPVWVKQ